MSGYSKLFNTMWGGSLYGRFEASAVFMVLLSLCDHNGDIDMTPEAIAGTTGWPLEFIRKGLTELESPDPRSRTPEAEGRRLMRLDEHRTWGWNITNYAKYREKQRSLERREYLAEAKRRERVNTCQHLSTSVNTSTTVNRNQPITEAEAEAEAVNLSSARALEVVSATLPTLPRQQILDLYHELLPTLPRVKVWNNTRQGYLRARWKEFPDLQLWRQFFLRVSKSAFLTGGSTGSRDRPPFVASLEWLLRPNNFAKVLEGKYDRT